VLSRSVSSADVNSWVWNGFTGASGSGENVSRFGVVTSKRPPGRNARRHSRTNSEWFHTCSMTCSVATTSTEADGTGSAARLARTNEACR